MKKHGSLKLWKKVARYLLTVVCCAYIVNFFLANRESFERVLLFDMSIVMTMLGLSVAAIGMQSYRYKIIIGKFSGKRLPYLAWLRIFVLGTFLNRIFPQAGNVFRGVSLKQRFDISYTRYISSYAGFMWIDTTLSIATALAVVLVLDPSLRIASVPAAVLIAALLCAVAAVPFVLKLVGDFLKGRFNYFLWLQSKLAEVFSVMADSVRDVGYLVRISATGLCSFAITISIFYMCFHGLGLDVSWSMLAVFCVIMRLSNQMVITPGNLGVREIAYGVLGELAGVGMAEAMLVSIIIRIVGTTVIFAFGTALGGVGLLKRHNEYTTRTENGDSNR